jgi:adenine-specific DNA methylase
MEFETKEKLRGGYYTPSFIAEFLTKWVFEIKPKVILEPSCGDGVFLAAIDKQFKDNVTIDAFEIEKDEAQKAKVLLKASNKKLNLYVQDFLEYSLKHTPDTCKYEAILGNPPFVRYQYLENKFQTEAESIFKKHELNFTKHTNLWVPFIISSITMLNPGGRLAMVIPSEILHVLHANELRKFLLDQCDKILIIDPEEIWFKNTLQGAVLIMAEKKINILKKSKGLSIEPITNTCISKIDPSNLFKNSNFINGDHLNGKWMKALLSNEELEIYNNILNYKNVNLFSKIASVDVGIVTGANNFFLVNRNTIDEFGLDKYAYPMFGRSDHVPGVIYDEIQHRNNQDDMKPSYFLYFDELDFENFPQNIKNYILMGEKEGLNKRYKCRVREPWYKVPSVYSTPLALLKRCHDYPRLILNSINAYTTDTAYRIKTQGVSNEVFVFSFINSLTALSSELEGRHYGGGVLELVPSEIENLIIPIYNNNVTKLLKKLNLNIKSRLSVDTIFEEQDNIILNKIGLSKKEQDIIHNAYNKLRLRRQRKISIQDDIIEKESAVFGENQ